MSGAHSPSPPEATTAQATRFVLWSRLLTHSGDQAWDFCVPLAMITAFPGALDVVSLYYLSVRIASVLLMPRLGRQLDRWGRGTVAALGIGAQAAGVIGVTAVLWRFQVLQDRVIGGAPSTSPFAAPAMQAAFAVLTLFGILSTLGSSLMSIAISQDWLPQLVPPAALPQVNSRLKQLDLGSELLAPIAAGALLALAPATAPFRGVALVALWNLLSFLPEYALLRRVLRVEKRLQTSMPTAPAASAPVSFFGGLHRGWRDFLAEPAAASMVAYSLLWLTVLSPHGVLLTAWLKVDGGVSDTALGVFRGLGAVFGLSATLVYPRLVRRFGVLVSSRRLILAQAGCLVLGGLAFAAGQVPAFLVMILLSRVGMYGFALGETEIRQRSIAPAHRGRVNGFAASLNNAMTLVLYGAGALLSHTSDFPVLIYGSIGCVVAGALLFTAWSRRQAGLLAT